MANSEIYAVSPKFRGAIAAVSDYLGRKANELSPLQLEAGDELKRRIRRMENDANRLVKINNILLDAEIPKVSFDQSTDTMTTTHRGRTESIKFNRADPKVPITLKGSSATGAYKAGSSNPSSSTPNTDELRMNFEQTLEHYYSNAFRITKLVQQVTDQAKYHCAPITIVRNKLVEHPEPGSIYSFGFSSNGPVVRPLFRGTRDWRDDGLVPNTVLLLVSLTSTFKNDA